MKIKFKKTLFLHNISKLIKKNSYKKNIPNIRPTTNILRNIIAICIILFIICLISGAYFGNNILSFINIKNEYGLWLPFFIFFGVLLIMGWGVIILFGGITSYLIKSKTTGVIEESKIRSFYDSDYGDTYYIFSRVNYTVNGFLYQNEEQHNFSSTDKNEAIDKLKSISPGDKITVLYDPKNPYLMALELQDKSTWGEIFTGILFIVKGSLFSIFLGTFLS